MAVRHGYGKIAGTDALVFAYDTGDTRNSYRGEPTENLYAGLMNLPASWSIGSNTSYVGTTEGPFPGTVGYKYEVLGYGNFYLIYNKTGLTAGATYTISVYVKMVVGTSTQNNGVLYSTDYNAGIPPSTNITSEWKRIHYTFTLGANSTSANIVLFGYDNAVGRVLAYSLPQLEQKSHPTQHIDGTRSATQGLLDLTGNNIIDLSSTGFDSNAQPVFDGTNNHMSVGTGILSGTGDFTVEAVIQSDYQEVNGTIFANYPAGNFQTFFSGRYIGLFLANNSAYLGSSPFTTVLPEFTTNPIHFVAQREGTTTRVYLNGVLKKTGSSSSTIGDTSAAFRVGANTSGGEDFLGDIFVVKAYNRALTEAEIRNNFNFYKSRFGI